MLIRGTSRNFRCIINRRRCILIVDQLITRYRASMLARVDRFDTLIPARIRDRLLGDRWSNRNIARIKRLARELWRDSWRSRYNKHRESAEGKKKSLTGRQWRKGRRKKRLPRPGGKNSSAEKNARKGTLSAKKPEGSTWLPSQAKSFEKPKRPSLVFTVSRVFCAGLILILRCCLEREARIILASHRVMILVRVSHVLPPMIAPRGGH